MPLILAAVQVLAAINGAVLAVGRYLAIGLMGLMVLMILIQVYFRYMDGSMVEAAIRSMFGYELSTGALPWPDEAARFMMLWLTGLVAPTAYRRGGFVAIDMLVLMLPRLIGGLITLLLLVLAFIVLVTAVQIGWGEVTGFGGKFKTAALWLPTNVSFTEWFRVPRSWMMASLLVGVTLMASVTVELILRQIAILFGRSDDLPIIPEAATVGAE